MRGLMHSAGWGRNENFSAASPPTPHLRCLWFLLSKNRFLTEELTGVFSPPLSPAAAQRSVMKMTERQRQNRPARQKPGLISRSKQVACGRSHSIRSRSLSGSVVSCAPCLTGAHEKGAGARARWGKCCAGSKMERRRRRD